jgi:hypothetical protein
MNRNSDTVDAVSTPREPARVPVAESQVSVADLAGGRLWELLDLYHAVIETVVTAETPEAIERGVCAALTDRGRFDFACLGAVGDDGTTPSIRTVAGVRDRDAVAVATAARSQIARAAGNRTLSTVDEEVVVDGTPGEYRLAVVPVRNNGTGLGTLVVASAAGGFSPVERTVLSSIGRYLGYATVALTRQAVVADDTLTELAVAVPTAETEPCCPVAAVADDTGSRLEYRGGVLTSHPQVVFLTVEEGDPAAVREALVEHPAVEDARTLKEGSIEVTSGATLPARLSAIGASVETVTFEPGETRATLRVPNTTGAKRVLDRAMEICSELTLTAKRRVRPGETDESTLASLPSTLTERQQEVLRAAYLAGFFDRPRETTGDEIAGMLDISSSTFHQHLRVALAKTLAGVFGDG